MLFKIKNTGAIERAEVLLDGLTLIGGENDTGKSTVGKLLFSIVKGIVRYEQDLNENKEQNLQKLIEDIYFRVRRLPPPGNFRMFNPNHFMNDLKKALGLVHEGQLELLPGDMGYSTIDEIIQSRIEWLKSIPIEPKFFSPKNIEAIISKLNDLKEVAQRDEDKSTIIKRALKKAINSEFYAELSPKSQSKITSEITLSEGVNSILELNLKNNDIEHLELTDLIFFEDVTFIETPVILQMYDVIRNAETLLELESEYKMERLARINRPVVSLHLKDLIAKIEKARYFSEEEDSIIGKVLKNIEAIIGGAFIFDKEQRDFSFNKRHNGQNKTVQIRPVNTASGIKSFGLIQLLLQAKFIDNRSLLIVDEPETHLHPKWQVEYARMLVELAKNDMRVLVTSHSPYFVQAIKVFSDKEGITENTHFYLATKQEKKNLSVIENVTDDLNRLFQKLAEPLQDLVWQ